MVCINLTIEAVIEDVVSASAANVTGDRGNPAYTATLNALEKGGYIGQLRCTDIKQSGIDGSFD